ncbi:hypothetical protein ACE1OC_42645 (plasmid) [Streptomyces sp. DSM 116496]|uniref:hypothetical protein n=1 Tax=Streptomyces stoeckheimensis TaxID=3344656 RepID=UPI0038B2527A
MNEELFTRSAQAVVTATRELLNATTKEPISTPEDLGDVLRPIAADLNQSLLDLQDLCDLLAKAAPQSIHTNHLRRCAEDLRTAAHHWRSITINSSCSGTM